VDYRLRMRGSLALLTLLTASSLAACNPSDPDLAKPCSARRAAAVTMGTGSDQFQAVDAAGVLIQTGPQGGNHIWMGLACRGLGPEVTLGYGIKDVPTGTDLTGVLEQVVDLTYDSATDTDEAGGMRGYLEPPDTGPITQVSDIVGHQVTLWADVTDTCHTTAVHAEVQALVTGFAPQ
jgi:hypothetical protein